MKYISYFDKLDNALVLFPVDKAVRKVVRQLSGGQNISPIRVFLNKNNVISWNATLGEWMDFELWLSDGESSIYYVNDRKISDD